MKNRFSGLLSKGMFVLLTVCVLSLTACSSSEDTANDYFVEGMKLYEKGELVKANIQFKNALQVDRTLTKAIWGQALVAEQQSNWKAAFKLLSNVLANEPNHIEAQVKLARIYLLAGKLDEALKLSDKSLSLDNTDPTVLVLRAAILLKLDNTQGAITFANKVLVKTPENIDALIILASERLLAGKPLMSIEFAEQGLAKDKKNIPLLLLKLQAFNKLAQLDKVEEVHQKLISYYPKIFSFNYALAQFYIKHDRFDDAEKELRSVVQKNPADHKVKLALIRFLNGKKGINEGRKQLELFSKQEPDNYELKFSLVSFYIGQKDFISADIQLKEIISGSSKDDDVLKAKGIIAGIMLAKGNRSGAEALINEVLVLDKHNQQVLILKAKIDIDRQKYDDAVGGLRTILRDTPNSSRALLLLAKAHLLSGSPELADEQYLRAFKSSKFSPAYGVTYANFLLKRKQADRAEGILQDALSVSPRNLPVLKLLAKTRLRLGNWVGAQEIADRIKTTGDKDKIADQIMGAILAGKKDFTKSIAILKQTYQSSKNNISPVVGLVRTYLMAGKVKEAGDFLDSVINANPENINARVLRAQIYSSQGSDSDAKRIYLDIINRAKNNPLGYYQLSLIHIKEKNINKAVDTLDKGLIVAPKNYALRITKANILTNQGKSEEAIAMYESLIDDRINSDIVANNLASLLIDSRKDKVSLNKAYSLSQRFKRSEIPQFKDTFGWASYSIGKYADANSLLKSAITALPNVPDFHYHLGMNHLAQKNKKLAREELEKALKLAGDKSFSKAEEIRSVLEKL